MENAQETVAKALARLEEPFASKDVNWLVAATSRDGKKGRVTPYADPRAYTDRLNEVFTPGGWTRVYRVHTVSPITRMRQDNPIQTGKVLVTCMVTIASVGKHSGSGEEWADDENAMTSAEAQAFKARMQLFRTRTVLLQLRRNVGGIERVQATETGAAAAGVGTPS